MKLILMIIAAIVLIPNIAFTKSTEIYSSTIDIGSVAIYLYKDGKYAMEITCWNGDQGTGFIISSGRYKSYKTNHILKDSYNHFNMKLISKNGYLIIEKSFLFTKNLKFQLDNNYSSFKEADFLDFPDTLEHKRILNKKTEVIKYDLEFGKYIGEGTLSDFNLNIRNSHRFELKVQDLILLSGTWKRTENELRLYDTTLKHTFFVFIAKNKLINYVFNEQIGDKYFKVKSNKKLKK
jgi:hypothetical protein